MGVNIYWGIDMYPIGFIKAKTVANFDEEIIRKMINQYYIGSPDCNEVTIDGEIVQKPDLPQELIDANYNVCGNRVVEITAEILANGQLKIVNVC